MGPAHLNEMCICEAYFRQSPEAAAIHVGHARTVQRLLREKQNHCYFLSVSVCCSSVSFCKISTGALVCACD